MHSHPHDFMSVTITPAPSGMWDPMVSLKNDAETGQGTVPEQGPYSRRRRRKRGPAPFDRHRVQVVAEPGPKGPAWDRVMLNRLRARNEWKFFAALAQADGRLALVWWLVLVMRGILPAVFAIAMGVLIAAVQRNGSLVGPLALTGAVFVLLQILAPLQTSVSQNLGDRTAAWLYDRLTRACVAPPGMGHLEDPRLTGDLTVARDFDLGMTGPPLSYALDFIAGGLVELFGGLSAAAVLFADAWWAPIVLAGAWLATHWLLRESAIWHDRNTDEVRSAQRDADYAYRLAVDPPGSKELRLCGLVGWTIDRFIARRTTLHQLRTRAAFAASARVESQPVLPPA
jgi:hypothetical protein